ncbi:DUF3810 domain-containing protein [Leeuwenhoekiella aequorea]|uniref:Amino acid permease n=1 Tax=Leeuwenhoekiella aequorea TaxID=283736 RepID=A0A4Q0P555_9FLAO|nr:DUF3810 domain-containing protein [Leeuwenhoekiella aequorea]RXG20749.1 putative protein DUF3810 [Leeuwenhoekiella aequorea]
MKYKKLFIYSALLLLQIAALKIVAHFPLFIENFYSTGFYSYSSKVFRFVFGWLPFSFGDVMYAILIFYLIISILNLVRNRFQSILKFITEGILLVNVLYFSFHILWGLNYYRLPLHESLSIEKDYSTEALVSLTQRLIKESNKLHKQLESNDSLAVEFKYSLAEVFAKTPEGYAIVEDNFPQLDYTPKSIKNSLFRLPLTYMGFGGYLNPITQEAQINGLMPAHRWPLVACHEEAHQLGFAKENEANFIAVMATTNNPDPYFKYSGYIFALRYCLGEVYNRNRTMGEILSTQVSPGIVANYRESQDFWNAYENPIEPILAIVYGNYLKVNNQPSGMQSYSYVVALLVNYFENKTTLP